MLKEDIEQLNRNLPISLEYLNDLIERVAIRYPVVSKYELILVIKTFFEKLRELLILRETISIKNLFNHMHLIYFSRIRNNKFHLISKIKLSTPRKLKNG